MLSNYENMSELQGDAKWYVLFIFAFFPQVETTSTQTGNHRDWCQSYRSEKEAGCSWVTLMTED